MLRLAKVKARQAADPILVEERAAAPTMHREFDEEEFLLPQVLLSVAQSLLDDCEGDSLVPLKAAAHRTREKATSPFHKIHQAESMPTT